MSGQIKGIEQLEHTLDRLVAVLSPSGRRKLGLKLGETLRRANAKRISANRAPMGEGVSRILCVRR